MRLTLNLADDVDERGRPLAEDPIVADVLAILFDDERRLYAVKVPDLHGAPWYGLIHDQSTVLVRRSTGEHSEEPENGGDFLNFYKCARCGDEWTDVWSATCDDDCPACGARA